MPDQPAPSASTGGGPRLAGASPAGLSVPPSRPVARAPATARRTPGEREASRKQLPPRAAYALAASLIGLGLFASVTPSPLYRSYSVLWHFSPLTLTLIFATYAFGVLTTLLLAGRVSDQVGRRPVLLAALGALMGSALLFMAASGTAWLFVARALQGLATGAALSTASAALLDLHPRRDAARVGLANGVASAGGLGLGFLVSSALVQLGPAPRVLPYVVLLVLFAAAFAGAYWMPEPVLERSSFRLTPQRPSVPAGIRHPFLLASLAVIASWSLGGLYFSLGPALSAQLFRSSSVLVAGIGAVALALAGALSQMIFHRTAPWIGAAAGSAALAAGTMLIVAAAATGSVAAYLAGSVVGGAGFGVAFLGGLRQLVAVIPHQHRAAVMSAFYVVAYASLSLPAVLAGLVVTHLGLHVTFETFGSIVAVVALAMAIEAWRTRPGRRRARVRG
jgi:predicted MFS family arabinose efflux permease